MTAATRPWRVRSDRARLRDTPRGSERAWVEAVTRAPDCVPLGHAGNSNPHTTNADKLAARMLADSTPRGARRHYRVRLQANATPTGCCFASKRHSSDFYGCSGKSHSIGPSGPSTRV